MSEFPNFEESPAPAPQLVPQSREAEEAVLGAVLINPEAYYDVAQFLLADDFYIHRHQWIWEVYTRLHERRIPIDFLTVTEELDQAGQLAEVGGPAYITGLINNVPTSLHAEAYGRIVEQTAIRRRMLAAANQIAKLAYQEASGLEAVMDEAEKAIFSVSERRMTRDLMPIKRVLSEYVERIDQLAQRGGETLGVPTGFYDLDHLLGGLQPSDFLIIAGRPGTGKTAFMLTIAKNAAQTHKKHIAVFSMEMSNEQLVQRLISQETAIDTHHLRTGKLSEDEWALLAHSIEVLGDTIIFLDDTPGLTPLQLRTKCRRLHMEFKLDLVLVDYLQLMSGGLRIENRVQEVSYISRNMKMLARELNVPVLAAAQLSRAIEQRADKEPQLSDLRESGSLEQDADIVMFIHRPELYEKDTLKQHLAQIKIAKHRNGPVGTVELVFRENLAKFENAATQRYDLKKVQAMGFNGFAESSRRQVHLPEQFFRELLPGIDDLDELRLTLTVLWRLQNQAGPFRCVRWRALMEDETLTASLGGKPLSIAAALEQALHKAETRGSLLQVSVEHDSGEERLVLLNSPRGRAALGAIRRGDLRLTTDPAQPLKFSGERPNVYQLYEASIGPLTPMIAEALKDAETTYDPAWVAEAIQIAVERSKRHWRYVEAILRRWEQGGRDDQKDRQDRRDSEEARRRYTRRDE